MSGQNPNPYHDPRYFQQPGPYQQMTPPTGDQGGYYGQPGPGMGHQQFAYADQPQRDQETTPKVPAVPENVSEDQLSGLINQVEKLLGATALDGAEPQGRNAAEPQGPAGGGPSIPGGPEANPYFQQLKNQYAPGPQSPHGFPPQYAQGANVGPYAQHPQFPQARGQGPQNYSPNQNYSGYTPVNVVKPLSTPGQGISGGYTPYPGTGPGMPRYETPKSKEPRGKAPVAAGDVSSLKTLQIIASPQKLIPLGKLKKMSEQDPNYKRIARYAANGCSTPKSQVAVVIHDIYELPLKTDLPDEVPQDRVLLFAETTPQTLTTIKSHGDFVMGFYDRTAKALAIRPDKVVEPFRQTLLVFAVSLGQTFEDSRGLKRWTSKSFPKDCNSIRVTGMYRPNWTENRDDGHSIIPCGETVKRSHEAKEEFNEYIVRERKRAKPRYAVDIEIFPGGGHHDDSDEEEMSEEGSYEDSEEDDEY